MSVSRFNITPDGPDCSRFAAGFWRLHDWKLSVSERLALIERYLDLGITTTDHADIYGGYSCEQLFGEALAQKPEWRDQMEIITKCGINLLDEKYPDRHVKHYDTSKTHILEAVDNSLSNLNCGYLDILLIHRPDPLMQADEVAEAFEILRTNGKVKHFGVSNFTPAQFSLLQSRLDYSLVTNQIELSPLALASMNDGSLDQCQQQRISPMIWSCLGGGKLFSDTSERSIQLRQILRDIAEETGAQSIEQVVYAWVLQLPSKPMPIIGSGNAERIKLAAESESIQLERQQWFRILESAVGRRVA
ncbi:aldo/keto reductase family oxidoreductase [Maricurvus nonylphenolicus]|uniref:aldo/keto reductase n=1 Tax=Maricurvus nonylphenolicus TaxID=1008307 RepID=UPI0036F27383